jgi:intracellular septation protein
MGLSTCGSSTRFSTDAWATFHSFGTTGLSILFIIGQGVYLSRHLEPAPADKQVP